MQLFQAAMRGEDIDVNAEGTEIDFAPERADAVALLLHSSNGNQTADALLERLVTEGYFTEAEVLDMFAEMIGLEK